VNSASNATIRLTAAQAIVRYLHAQHSSRDGARRRLIPGVFGIFGHGNVAGLGQALEEYGEDLTFYQGKNEQAMVHAATGFAKATKRTATLACTSSIGPGATNMITGAATATINRLPVLLLPSDYYGTRRQGPVLQQLEHPISADVSVNDAFRPVSRFFDRILRPEQLLAALPEAMRVLTSPVETGAVTISLPQDVQMMACDYPEAFFEERDWEIDRPRPSRESLERAAEAIRHAEKPVAIVGGGVHYSDAAAGVAAFCAALGIPVAETHGGKGAGVAAGELYLGGTGVAGNQAAAAACREADVVIGIGTRFADFATGSQSAFQHPGVRFVSMNVSGHDAYKQGAVPVTGDALAGIRELGELLAGYRSPEAWRRRVGELRSQWEKVRRAALAQGPDGRISQLQTLRTVNEFAAPNSMTFGAAGSFPGDMLQQWDPSGDRHCLLEFGYSCMGWEVPAAIGGKLAYPERDVYALVGDGTYLMNSSGIVTAVQEGVKVVIVVAVNRGFQVIRKLQLAKTGAPFGNEFRAREGRRGPLAGGYREVDYAKNAESLGAVGLRADSAETLQKALQESRDVRARPVVIAVDVPPDVVAPESTVWWDIAVAEVSLRPSVRRLREQYERDRAKQRFYY